MLIVARIYLALMLLMFAVIGAAALIDPHAVAARLYLQPPESLLGLAEIRGLYGGAFISWAIMGIAAWRIRPLAPGLLLALAITMGAIAAARLVSLATDHEVGFNLQAFVPEALFALACWVLYRNEKLAR